MTPYRGLDLTRTGTQSPTFTSPSAAPRCSLTPWRRIVGIRPVIPTRSGRRALIQRRAPATTLVAPSTSPDRIVKLDAGVQAVGLIQVWQTTQPLDVAVLRPAVARPHDASVQDQRMISGSQIQRRSVRFFFRSSTPEALQRVEHGAVLAAREVALLPERPVAGTASGVLLV